MGEPWIDDEQYRLELELATLRMAKAALEEQLQADADRTHALLRNMELTTSSLKDANENLSRQRDFTQRVMDTTEALVLVVTADGRLRQINHSCSRSLGLDNAVLGEHVIDDWLHPDERRRLKDALPKLPWQVHSPLFETLRRTGAYVAEHRLRTSETEYRFYLLEASLQHAPNGQEEGAVICATDINQLKQEQKRLIDHKERLKEAQFIAQITHWESDVESGTLSWSSEADHVIACRPTDGPSSFPELLEMVHADDRKALEDAYVNSLLNRTPCSVTHRLILGNGAVKWIQHRIKNYYDLTGAPQRSVGTLQDITEQHLANEQLSVAASVFDNSLNGILITDPRARIIRANRVFCEILGYSAVELLGKRPGIFRSDRHGREFYAELWDSIRREGKWQGEIWDRCKDGSVVPLWQNISAVRNSEGHLTHYISVCHDLSEQKQSAEHIHHLAYYDALTDLPNRQLFKERCEHALQRAQRNQSMLAVLFLDLDRFKHVNDSLGHSTGDKLLRAVAERLKRAVRQNDTVARLGGDEFIILIEEYDNIRDIELVARKILNSLIEPVNVVDYSLEVRTSIGISCFPSDGTDYDTLIKHADLAMYRAKERGRGTFQFYESHLTTNATERLLLEIELREAIGRNELFLQYQPIYSMQEQRITGAEALLRWKHGSRGLIAPDRFVPVAEDSGLIIEIGEWVLREACRQAKVWLDAGLDLGHISVNLSGLQIERGDLYATLCKVLGETQLPPRYLTLEVTETYIMREAERNIQTLERLRALGVSLAIDDFGTGQSSLAHLKLLPVDTLKVDRSFVMDIPKDSNDMAITGAILALGHSLQLSVLAEGVETKEQVAFLKELGCDAAQGFFYSPPVGDKELQALLPQRPEPAYPPNVLQLHPR